MRYWKLWLKFLEMSWMADMEYRLNVVLRVVAEVGWYLAQVSVFEVLYTHTQTISGWDIHGMRVFMGTLFLSDVIYMIVFSENLENVFSLVRRGDLDQYLVKPIDSQFMVSMRKISTAYIINFFGIIVYLMWAIHSMPQDFSVGAIVAFFLMVGLGVVTIYSLRFLFSSLIVILQDAGNVHYLWYQIFRLGTRPDPIYPFYIRVLVMTVVPVAFFASVPARILVEGLDWRLCLSALLLAGFLLFTSHFVWNKALKRYSSASS